MKRTRKTKPKATTRLDNKTRALANLSEARLALDALDGYVPKLVTAAAFSRHEQAFGLQLHVNSNLEIVNRCVLRSMDLLEMKS